jgi:hypothetical protein
MNSTKYIVEKIDNFDSSGTNVIFSFVNGFSGSVLLQSFIDGHPEVLNIPNFCGIYFQWELILKKIEDKKVLVDKFMQTWLSVKDGGSPLEGNHDELFYDNYKSLLLSVLDGIQNLDRKKFILAINFCYAIVKNIDIANLKVIYIHQHYYTSAALYSFEHFLGEGNQDLIYDETKKDFPMRKFIISIRHFMDSYNSTKNFYKRNKAYLGFVWGTFLNGLFELHYFLKLKQKMNKDLLFVKFEELHLMHSTTMKKLAQFCNIDFLPILLESTFDGLPWYGNNPDNKINGINANFDTTAWQNKLDQHEKILCANLYNSLCKEYNYPPFEIKNNNKNIYKLTKLENHLIINYIYNHIFNKQNELEIFNSTYLLFIIIKETIVNKDFFKIIQIIKEFRKIKNEYKQIRYILINHFTHL